MDIREVLNYNKGKLVFDLVNVDELYDIFEIWYDEINIGMLEMCVNIYDIHIRKLFIFEDFRNEGHGKRVVNHLRRAFKEYRLSAYIDETEPLNSFWLSFDDIITYLSYEENDITLASYTEQHRHF